MLLHLLSTAPVFMKQFYFYKRQKKNCNFIMKYDLRPSLAKTMRRNYRKTH